MNDSIIDPASKNILEEFSGAYLGDSRLEKRLLLIAEKMAIKPVESFPSIFSAESEAEAFYRFLRNPSVHWANILKPHYDQTQKRIEEEEESVIIHDSSTLQFERQNKSSDLGIVSSAGKNKLVGFLGHFSLAVSGVENPKPLGLTNLITIRRFKKSTRTRHPKKDSDPKECESRKWIEGVRDSRERLGSLAKIIHVMDAEGDSYSLIGDLVASSECFVIRSTHDRRIIELGQISKISKALAGRPVICEREVHLCVKPMKKKQRLARSGRKAQLTITATSVNIKRSQYNASHYPRKLRVNIVHAFEPNPPEGEPAVDWKLITTEPVDSAEQILKIVDIYRARWIIEEYFKAIKTGCSYEDRQLESFKTVMNALAIILPIAWQMLLLRHCSREGELATHSVLSDTQLAILIAMSKGKLNEHSTNTQLLYAVAEIGGHFKSNGPPGWLVLYRGMRELYTLEKGVKLNLNFGAMQYAINR